MEENLTQQINAYLRGRLSEEERTAFEDQIQQDPELETEVQTHANILNATAWGEKERLQGVLNNLEAEVANSSNESESSSSPRSRLWYFAAAAVVALLIGMLIFNFLHPPTAAPQTLAENYLQKTRPDNFLATLGQDSLDAEDKAALNAYSLGEYQEAVDHLRTVPEDHGYYVELSFFEGVSLLFLDDADGAISALKPVIEAQGPLADKAQWFTALALLKQEKVNEAKGVLEGLAGMGKQGFPYKDAEGLLGEL